MQYHVSHAMTGLEEGGDGGVSWTWLDNVSDGCGIEVCGGRVDTALPQVRFNIARAHNCMIECKGETRWCTGDDKKHTTISHSRGCDCDNGGHFNKKGQEEAGCGAGQQRGGGRLQSGSSRLSPQRRQCKGKGSNTKEVEEGHSQRTPASRTGQGEREHWAMVVED